MGIRRYSTLSALIPLVGAIQMVCHPASARDFYEGGAFLTASSVSTWPQHDCATSLERHDQPNVT